MTRLDSRFVSFNRFSRSLLIIVLFSFASFLLLWFPGHASKAQQQGNTQGRQLTRDDPAEQRKRLALVIGNGNYANAKPLKNPANDATAITATLRELGFDVVSGVNLSQREMKLKMREFGQRLRTQGGVGVFFFAGHGVQSRGHNFLVPVEADIQTEADLEDQTVDVNYILGLMDDAQNGLNIVVLDACRNNPFSARSFRSVQDGLAQVKAPTGTLIAYATSPDSVASDGTGQNGLYTQELLKQIRVPGVLVETMFRRVTEKVSARTSGKQEPWYSANVKGDFYFKSKGSANSAPPSNTTTKPATVDPVAIESEYWETIRNSTNPQDYRDFLNSNPNGAHAAIAKTKLRQLEEARTAPSNPVGNSGNPTSRPPATTARTRTNQAGIEFVLVPAGEFMMGSNNGEADEKPVHRVPIVQPFYMGKYEVTQAQWKAVMENNPSYFKDCNSCPVEQVSWGDAQQFINKLNETSDGYSYRLPSEAEWEYSCRAGTSGDHAGDLDSMAWYKKNSANKTHPVGTKQPNAWGLFDMHGDVWEWCQDWYDENYYRNSPSSDPNGPSSGQHRVLRGGSWNGYAGGVRSAYRSWGSPDDRVADHGFRVVAVVRTQ